MSEKNQEEAANHTTGVASATTTKTPGANGANASPAAELRDAAADAEGERLFHVAVNAAFALRHERGGNRDQFLHLRVEYAPLRRVVKLLVIRAVNFLHARLKHRVRI